MYILWIQEMFFFSSCIFRGHKNIKPTWFRYENNAEYEFAKHWILIFRIIHFDSLLSTFWVPQLFFFSVIKGNDKICLPLAPRMSIQIVLTNLCAISFRILIFMPGFRFNFILLCLCIGFFLSLPRNQNSLYFLF